MKRAPRPPGGIHHVGVLLEAAFLIPFRPRDEEDLFDAPHGDVERPDVVIVAHADIHPPRPEVAGLAGVPDECNDLRRIAMLEQMLDHDPTQVPGRSGDENHRASPQPGLATSEKFRSAFLGNEHNAKA